jgi:hypothetical protein
MSLQGNFNPDASTLAALTADTGPLCAGALPGADCANAEGEKALWATVGHTPVAKPKPKPKPKDETAEECVPKTPKQIL